MAESVVLQESITAEPGVISFTEISYRIVKRLNEYYGTADKKPKPIVIRRIQAQLPFIAEKLDQIEQIQQYFHLTQPFRKLINRLDNLTTKLYPLKSDLDLSLSKKFIKGVYYESSLYRAWKEIDIYKSTILFYFTDLTFPDIPQVLEVESSNAKESSVITAVVRSEQKCYYNYPSSYLSYFVDRPNISDRINKNFTSLKSHSKHVVVLSGICGCGKTEAAIKYCKEGERVKRFSVIFWIDATSQISIDASFSNIASILGGEVDAGDPERSFSKVRNYLQSINNNWLLVFDNLDDVSNSIQEYFPTGKLGYIIVTSRIPKLNKLGKVVSLDTMTELQSLQLLFRYGRPDRKPDGKPDENRTVFNLVAAKKLVARLGYLSVAIDQISSYINNHNIPIHQINDYYNLYPGIILSELPLVWPYKNTVYSIWEHLENQFIHTQIGPTIGSLLLACLYLNNQYIFEDLFKEYHQHQKVNWMNSFLIDGEWSSLKFTEVLSQLSDLNLVTIKRPTETGVWVVLHPLVQDCIRVRSTDKNLRDIQIGTIHLLGLYISRGTSRLLWDTKKAISAHLNVCFPETSIIDTSSIQEREALVNATFSFALLYHDLEEFEKAEILYDYVLKAREEQYGKSHPSTLEVLTILGVLYHDEGELYKAEAIFNQALEECVHELGAEHWLTPFVILQLGSLYHDQRKFSKAEMMYRKSLDSNEKSFGMNHHRTLKAVNSLGDLYFDQHLVLKAESMYKRAFEGRVEKLGREHPATLDTSYKLGLLYRIQKRYKESESMLSYALEGRERVLGPEHRKTIETIISLGNLYFEEKRFDKAGCLYEKALQAYTNKANLENPLVVVIRDKLNVIHKTEQF